MIRFGKEGSVATTRKYQKSKPELREQAARLVVDNARAIAEVARELGVPSYIELFYNHRRIHSSLD